LRLFCSGVYFTTLDPDLNSKTKILKNNFDDGSVANNDNFRYKADNFVAVNIPNDKVEKVGNTKRDIFVVKDDVKLNEHPHYIAKYPGQK
jgi:hypothetical protein